MERDIYAKLNSWKLLKDRKPLILQGARQVGKTYLLKEFGKKEYEDFAYFNFEEEPRLADFFKGSLAPDKIIATLSLFLGKKIVPEKTLVFFDEIQAAPNALNSLKYFCEDAPQYHIVAAGSLLGVALESTKSFPVGKVNFLQIHPMTFFEFLNAIGKSDLRKYLEDIISPEPIENIFHEECCELLKRYYFIGGMPAVVAKYVENSDWDELRRVQKEILASYILDFSKHAAKSEAIRIMAIWDSMPRQLAQESKKFKYSLIKRTARARDYEEAVQWIYRAGLINLSRQVSTAKIPFKSYTGEGNFKAYLFDTGLLCALVDLRPQIIIDGDKIFSEFKGSLAENFVAQELRAGDSQELYYWSEEQVAEIEFLLEGKSGIYPLEVKSGFSRKKQSLLRYQKKFHPKLLLRTGLLNLKKNGEILNCPLYLISRIANFI
ncbi:MAG: ATP-binding protein [Bdellovibrio sp.]|nr:ATP-binding protein [Bdellovibrio sp.]